ncbi:hypothetical protein ACH4YO_38005 [Streptomyces noursei]|uniref:hypothetical protein n=1 Tax=Streptomyces noursei TaxID=1971 RepID=UPI00081CC21D|nr:membrane protein [Streptomyces noursei ATCC 11455]ANZ21937.1 membrane protein [Streptomyces noursei ATCC 11455]MCZ0996532.1 hypothetical protein [Streptomyces noursei]
MLTKLVARASVWAADYRERMAKSLAQPDRGDISITTVIIWAAAIGGAIVIAGTIAAVVKKYDGKLGGV